MTGKLVIGWDDIKGFKHFNQSMHGLSRNISLAAVRALNRTGDTTRVQVRRALSSQTGLKQKTLRKALKVKKAKQGTLTYEIYASGGEIALKYFAPRETKAGVSANPFGSRMVFDGTFMKGGRFPKRHGSVFKGQVVERASGGRFPIRIIKSGVIIPNEMVKDESKAAFDQTVRDVLPKRMGHELARLGL